MLTVLSSGIFLRLKVQKRQNKLTVLELHPNQALLQKLQHRTAFPLMLIYTALNLAVILTEHKTSRV